MSSNTAEWKDVVTIGIALVGAVLGIMNTWHAMSQKRVRVRVTPNAVLSDNHEPLGYSIEVINLSTFPLTVVEVGFRASGHRTVPLRSPHFMDGKQLPRRIEPREAISAMFGPADFPVPDVKLGDAYARMACGTVVSGNSPAGRQFGEIMYELATSRRPQ